MIEVNIGLATNDGGTITVAQAIEAVQRAGFIVAAHRVVYAQHAFGGEDTLVAKLLDTKPSGWHQEFRLHLVAKELRQDAIAVLLQVGKLVGPHAERWGGFDPAYFHRFNERLAA